MPSGVLQEQQELCFGQTLERVCREAAKKMSSLKIRREAAHVPSGVLQEQQELCFGQTLERVCREAAKKIKTGRARAERRASGASRNSALAKLSSGLVAQRP